MDQNNSPLSLRKPILVYDGECGFCKKWVSRGRRVTGDAVDYRPLQAAAKDFPQIPRETFERAVKLIEPDGTFTSSAEAVFRLFALGGFGAGRWFYDYFPGFALISEFFYRLVAANRATISKFTRWL